MPTRKIALTGKLPKLSTEDASRLAVYVVRGSEILTHAPVSADGSFRVDLSREFAASESNYGVDAVVGPAGMHGHLGQVAGLQRLPLNPDDISKADSLSLATDKLNLSPDILRIWWGWCYRYCVRGTVVDSRGCPVPGAQVTVNTVSHTFGGYSTYPRVTVTADQNGAFTACFNWCTCWTCRLCWPCWPIWWECWPWWWEFDILHIIRNLELTPVQLGPVGPGPVERLQTSAALAKPEVTALVAGQGFAYARDAQIKFQPDVARTALIKRKLANPAIRARFPWWWWCCDNPNITFTVTQGANTILNENPATDTRWCLANNSNVVLVANSNAVGHCAGDPPPAKGFAWTRVGLIPVADIHAGYADSFGGTTDLAFAGSLDVYGGFAPSAGVVYYQVEAAQWTGDPSRGGTPPAPGSGVPISADLYNYLYIFDGGGTCIFNDYVKMGPFSLNGVTNLYATEDSRPTAPTGTGLPAFPNPAGAVWHIWAFEGRKIYTDASNLIAGHLVGAVDLTLRGYDAAAVSHDPNPDPVLTLTIDDDPNFTHVINSLTAYSSPGVLAQQTGTGDCPAYDLTSTGFVVANITVSDVNGHLYGYELDAEWGHAHSASVSPTPHYYGDAVPGTFPPGPYQSPDYVHRSFGGGTEVLTYTPTASCCYEFRIRGGKRVTNGYSGPGWGDYDFWTISLKV